VAQGKVQPHTSPKNLNLCRAGFFGANSEYACVNFFTNYFDFKNGTAASHWEPYPGDTRPAGHAGCGPSCTVCGRKLRPPPKSDRFTEVAPQRYEGPVSSLLKGGDYHPLAHMPAAEEGEKVAARVFYVAATRATQKLVMGGWGWGIWGAIVPCAITSLASLVSIILNSETCPR
jgi:hypothetical protein